MVVNTVYITENFSWFFLLIFDENPTDFIPQFFIFLFLVCYSRKWRRGLTSRFHLVIFVFDVSKENFTISGHVFMYFMYLKSQNSFPVKIIFCKFCEIFKNIYFANICEGLSLKNNIFTRVSFRKTFCFYCMAFTTFTPFTMNELRHMFTWNFLNVLYRVIFQNFSELFLLNIL